MIKPQTILVDMGRRAILIDMIEGPKSQRDDDGVEYETLRRGTEHEFLNALAGRLTDQGAGTIVWRNWPKMLPSGAIYGRFTIKPPSARQIEARRVRAER